MISFDFRARGGSKTHKCFSPPDFEHIFDHVLDISKIHNVHELTRAPVLSGHHWPGLLRPPAVPGLAPAGAPHRPPVAVSLHQGQV